MTNFQKKLLAYFGGFLITLVVLLLIGILRQS